jgi:THO complex subunit 3
VHQVLWSPVDDNSLSIFICFNIASFSSDKTMKLWDVRSAKTTRSERIKGGCSNVTWSNDGNTICYSNKDDDMLTIYDCRKSSILKQIDFKYQASEFQFEKNCNCLLVSSSLGELYIYDAKTFNSTPLATVVAHFAPINSIHIEPGNKYFATAAADSLICLWDLQEMISYKVIKKGESSIKKILYSHDSKFIASISDENNIDIFEIETCILCYKLF